MPQLLTIIIPTYNRPDSLLRTVHFLRRQSPALPLIVADGSAAQYAPHNAQCAGFGDNVVYFHEPSIPDENPWKNYCRRMQQALARSDTPYSVACADDDLLISENAVQAAKFLDENPSYVGCHGHYLQFEYAGDIIRIPNVEYQEPSIDTNEISGRLLQLFSRYEALFYAVFRTAAMRVLLDRYSEPNPPLWPEIYHSTSAVIAGKIYRSNTIYCLRNIGNPPHYSAQASYRNFGEWIAADLDGFLAHYIKYRASALEWAATSADENNLHTALDLAFMTYIGSEFNASYWIDRCCAAVKDQTERAKLRERLTLSLSRSTMSGTIPSIRRGGMDFIRPVLGQIRVKLLPQIAKNAVRAVIKRRPWTRLERSAPSRDAHYYGIEVRKHLLERFPAEQWNLLKGIER